MKFSRKIILFFGKTKKKKQFAKLAKAVNVLKSLGCGHSRVDVVFQVQI